MTSGALVLAALGAIGLVIWYSLVQVLPAEGGADSRCRRSVAGTGRPRSRVWAINKSYPPPIRGSKAVIRRI